MENFKTNDQVKFFNRRSVLVRHVFSRNGKRHKKGDAKLKWKRTKEYNPKWYKVLKVTELYVWVTFDGRWLIPIDKTDIYERSENGTKKGQSSLFE